jgi:hypothetical protein
MPQTAHDQGNTKASNASLRPLNQAANVLRIAAGGENRSQSRMGEERIEIPPLQYTLKSGVISALTGDDSCVTIVLLFRSADAALAGQEIGLKLFTELISSTGKQRFDSRRRAAHNVGDLGVAHLLEFIEQNG